LRQLYIPNVIAKPFALDHEYVEEVVRRTSSEDLQQVLSSWNDHTPSQIATTLLIELLAYQFASPVQWIQTQSVLFDQVSTG
jgi:malonyl CoA-acyl carrier protein transacylase